MFKLLTDCDKCMHEKMCKYRNNPKVVMKKLKDTQYGKGPNDDYGWEIMTQHEHVDISFSCSDYQEK